MKTVLGGTLALLLALTLSAAPQPPQTSAPGQTAANNTGKHKGMHGTGGHRAHKGKTRTPLASPAP